MVLLLPQNDENKQARVFGHKKDHSYPRKRMVNAPIGLSLNMLTELAAGLGIESFLPGLCQDSPRAGASAACLIGSPVLNIRFSKVMKFKCDYNK
jgi:hypothetical protein